MCTTVRGQKRAWENVMRGHRINDISKPLNIEGKVQGVFGR